MGRPAPSVWRMQPKGSLPARFDLMAIPGFSELIRPILVALEKGQERPIGDVRDQLARELALSPRS